MIRTEALRHATGSLLRTWTRPLVGLGPIDRLPGWIGTLHNIKVPGNIRPNAYESPEGSSNIRIIFRLLEEALALPGDVAECGVWHGSALIPTGLFVRERAAGKRVLGFDSFEGLDESVERDVELGGGDDYRKTVGGFSNTSFDFVQGRVRKFGVQDTITLVKGYFENTLHRFADSRFCFVHLDCVIYESYKQCLDFFYPRMAKGGIILLDEYNDPPWPGCTLAVDEFLADKPEKVIEIKSDNHVRYYIRKG